MPTHWHGSTSTLAMTATYGYAKQGAGYGYSGVKGLNALLATVSTPLAAPVSVATRLRKGSAHSARGAARLVADALKTARAAGAGGPDGQGLVVLRADSAYYNHDVVAAARRAGARFSITARASPALSRAIASINEDAWTAISYPHAVWDDQAQCLISDAEIAEVPFTAFTSRRKADHISARLIVRRVKRLNPTSRTASKTATTTKAAPGTDRAGKPGSQDEKPRQGRVVLPLPLPLRVHRQPAHPGPGREAPPRARRHRTGPRRHAARGMVPL